MNIIFLSFMATITANLFMTEKKLSSIYSKRFVNTKSFLWYLFFKYIYFLLQTSSVIFYLRVICVLCCEYCQSAIKQKSPRKQMFLRRFLGCCFMQTNKHQMLKQLFYWQRCVHWFKSRSLRNAKYFNCVALGQTVVLKCAVLMTSVYLAQETGLPSAIYVA